MNVDVDDPRESNDGHVVLVVDRMICPDMLLHFLRSAQSTQNAILFRASVLRWMHETVVSSVNNVHNVNTLLAAPKSISAEFRLSLILYNPRLDCIDARSSSSHNKHGSNESTKKTTTITCSDYRSYISAYLENKFGGGNNEKKLIDTVVILLGGDSVKLGSTIFTVNCSLRKMDRLVEFDMPVNSSEMRKSRNCSPLSIVTTPWLKTIVKKMNIRQHATAEVSVPRNFTDIVISQEMSYLDNKIVAFCKRSRMPKT